MSRKKSVNFSKAYEKVKARQGVVFPEPLVKSWLAGYGVPTPRGRELAKFKDAQVFARKLGYPVVVKLVADRLLHKTELGGVRVGIDSDKALKAAFGHMGKVGTGDKKIGYRGVLIEAQAAPGIEVIAGLQNDPHFGPVLMVGLGGVMTDLFKDVAFRLLPVTRRDIKEMLGELRGAALLEGFRGADKPDMKALVKAVERIAALGRDAAPWFESADFNPIIVNSRGAVVVDAKMVLAREPLEAPLGFEAPRTRDLDRFFNPGSVAVVGASASPGKIGNVIVDSLANYEFKGRIYPINPNRDEIMGLKCYPDLGSLPEPPELVVIVVDLGQTPALLREMHGLGSRNALIVSGGGKELGGERERIEAEIAALALQLDIRIIGPNCIGAFDGGSRFDSFFHHRDRLLRPKAGPMSFITQSGTWGCGFLELAEDIGVGKMVSYGNRVDVDEGDLIACLAEDDETKVIGSYIEGLGRGRKFLAAARTAVGKGKPVVVFKTGRNPGSARASVSHTGAYGGSYEVYEGVLRQAGIIAVDSFHEIYAACEALALQPPAAGPGAAMLSNGAGPMVNAMDLFPAKGLELVRLKRRSVESMRGHFSFFYLVENPVDVTGSASAADYEFVIRTMIQDPGVDVIMPFFVFQDTPLDESIVERMAALAAESPKPIVGCAVGGPYTERMSTALRAAGVPVLPDVNLWVTAASALVQWGRIKKRMGA